MQNKKGEPKLLPKPKHTPQPATPDLQFVLSVAWDGGVYAISQATRHIHSAACLCLRPWSTNVCPVRVLACRTRPDPIGTDRLRGTGSLHAWRVRRLRPLVITTGSAAGPNLIRELLIGSMRPAAGPVLRRVVRPVPPTSTTCRAAGPVAQSSRKFRSVDASMPGARGPTAPRRVSRLVAGAPLPLASAGPRRSRGASDPSRTQPSRAKPSPKMPLYHPDGPHPALPEAAVPELEHPRREERRPGGPAAGASPSVAEIEHVA
mmetsp:Transcript_100668/g.285272  ORF Transcript_100668/g.285272 Transcript_100668/m.285272 type:complete len:262 (-) Transcript_100668:829-1614(-)